jgi:hypothetical protein
VLDGDNATRGRCLKGTTYPGVACRHPPSRLSEARPSVLLADMQNLETSDRLPPELLAIGKWQR